MTLNTTMTRSLKTNSIIIPAPFERLAEAQNDPGELLLLEGIQAFSTTRHGGVSKGSFGTLNCTYYTDDNPNDVAENLRRLRSVLGVSPSMPFVIPRQTHSINVRRVDGDIPLSLLYEVDALITDRPDVMLCVSTADCLPIFFFDPCRKVVALAHAGWRGVVGHIVTRTVRALQENYGVCPANLRVAFGPCIGLDSFEVGDEVHDAFVNSFRTILSAQNSSEEVFASRYPICQENTASKWHIDLQSAVAVELQYLGISPSRIEYCPICTYMQVDDFFSARRLGIRSGRILSGIRLKSR